MPDPILLIEPELLIQGAALLIEAVESILAVPGSARYRERLLAIGEEADRLARRAHRSVSDPSSADRATAQRQRGDDDDTGV